jgi:hypothetical protein
MRRRSAGLVLAVLLLAPTFAAAKPLTLNFTGAWHHHDSQQDTPEFHAAMAAVGVDNGTPIFWSLFVDDVDLNPDPARSTYSVLGSELSFGSLSLTSGPSTLSLMNGDGGFFWAGTMGPPVAGFRPEFLQLRADLQPSGPGPFSTPIGVLNHPGLFIGFNTTVGFGGAQFRSTTALTHISPIPEPEIYAMMGVGLALLGWVGRRKKLKERAAA